MIKLILILLYICIGLIISMWLCLGGQIINIKKDLYNIKSSVHCTDSAINNYYIWLRDHIDDVNNHLTTEIACLATKNNEDIKRVKTGFQKWDIFEYDGVKFFIYDIENCADGGILYRCQRDDGFVTTFKPIEMTQASFIRSASPWLGEEKGE